MHDRRFPLQSDWVRTHTRRFVGHRRSQPHGVVPSPHHPQFQAADPCSGSTDKVLPLSLLASSLERDSLCLGAWRISSLRTRTVDVHQSPKESSAAADTGLFVALGYHVENREFRRRGGSSGFQRLPGLPLMLRFRVAAECKARRPDTSTWEG